ncbi:MAG: (Fe-S)-binding protein [Desulfarculus sp.]|nr:(Fe-S)-binding protein [Desulfarculus sp.]
MEPVILSPAALPATQALSLALTLAGLGLFAFILGRRLAPLRLAQADLRPGSWGQRLAGLLKYWLAQYKQPRYPLAGLLHILLFLGFLVLSLRTLTLIFIGFWDGFTLPGLAGQAGHVYALLKDYTATLVLVVAVVAAVRRGVFKPARYAVPPQHGQDHTGEALLVLGFIATLMLSEALFEASLQAALTQAGQAGQPPAPGSLAWLLTLALGNAPRDTLQGLHLGGYFVHDLAFYGFLCLLPLGKHFHVLTSLPNVLFMKLAKGSVKPVRWGVADDKLDDLESFGVKRLEDFTWKHLLDFYSCADCGRCADNCPANAVGRPLSPRFLTIKARDLLFSQYPLHGASPEPQPLVGGIYSEDEIWSCTTCGACEEECPLMIEYIDKIVDLRRGLVDDGEVPASLQAPLKALDKRGNPFGKKEKARADWTLEEEFARQVEVKVLDGEQEAQALYFVDSITSYDPRLQDIARATARLLTACGVDFGILGKAEKDSGHEARRFGEEMLFQALKEHNSEAIAETGVTRIITSDPHAYNALTKDYAGLPPVEHLSQTLQQALAQGHLSFQPLAEPGVVYTLHDPCYLGRHNGLYEAPRQVLDAIPGLRRVEMERSQDRSFCCGGGGLMLFYEPVEETRMGRLRVEMAHKAGAEVIVTACPCCLVNIEDAIKTSGLEGKMRVMDLSELAAGQLSNPVSP